MGFFDPINLLYGLSLLALIAIYLRAKSRPMIHVSSLSLFEEVPAPVSQSRFLQLDLLFWLEAAALVALTCVMAGLYMRSAQPVRNSVRRALIFDVGASMGASDSGSTRLVEAQRDALAIANGASASDQFSAISYALDARLIQPYDSRRDQLDRAIRNLRAEAVATRSVALQAALASANDAVQIDLYTDHTPDTATLESVRRHANLKLHLIDNRADNMAIVSLDPGIPKRSEGRALIRNFASHPQTCELRIEAGNQEVFHSSLVLEPRSSTMVPFGPIQQGGVVHARILTQDALAADNERWASSPGIESPKVLIVSPDRTARDDLARVLLAVNSNYRITAIGTSPDAMRDQVDQKFDLVVLHDWADDPFNASNRLYVFPPRDFATKPQKFHVTKDLPAAELQSRTGAPPFATPVLLGPTRVVALPDWMTPLAQGAETGGKTDMFPMAAAGQTPQGSIGVVAFDVRNHMLLDPDRQEALLLVIDAVRELGGAADHKIVPTGELVPIATFGPATLTAPDGTKRELLPDKAGQIRFRPLQAGRYRLSKDERTVEIYANYFDEAESDLASVSAAPAASSPTISPAAATTTQIRAVPQASLLIAIVILALLAESTLIVRRAQPLESRDV